MKATETSPTAARLSPQQAAAAVATDATDIIANAYDHVMSDAKVRTSHDAAKYILGALQAADHGSPRREPACLGFNGKTRLDWSGIEGTLIAIDTIGVKVEMLGRCAVDNVHSEKLTDVFGSVREELQEQLDHLKMQLGLLTSVEE